MELSKLEVTNLIAGFVLDFKALLEQVVQVVRIKKNCQSTRENNRGLARAT